MTVSPNDLDLAAARSVLLDHVTIDGWNDDGTLSYTVSDHPRFDREFFPEMIDALGLTPGPEPGTIEAAERDELANAAAEVNA